MGSVKQQMLRFVEGLPEDATWEDVMEEVYFRSKVDSGLKELDSGKAISHAKVKERLAGDV